jgi:hypothetical protein
MIRRTIFVAALALSGIAAADAPRATSFAWMTGCWGYGRDGGSYVENWLPATGNVIIGASQRVVDGFSKEFEYLRIVTSGDGFDYVRQPQGEAEVRYGMTGQQAKRINFESLSSSEFPTKISYELTAPDALTEKLEGTSKGSPVTVTFPLRRVSCSSN